LTQTTPWKKTSSKQTISYIFPKRRGNNEIDLQQNWIFLRRQIFSDSTPMICLISTVNIKTLSKWIRFFLETFSIGEANLKLRNALATSIKLATKGKEQEKFNCWPNVPKIYCVCSFLSQAAKASLATSAAALSHSFRRYCL